MAEHLYTYVDPSPPRDVAKICRVLSLGGVVAWAIDLNWSFSCCVDNVKGMDRIRSLKGMSQDHPFSVICNEISMAAKYGNIDGHRYKLLRKLCPGPYTFLVERNRNIARQLRDKRKVLGIRIPDSPLVREVIGELGEPVVASSVPSGAGGRVLRYGTEVYEQYERGVDMIVDLGAEVPGEESTVVDLTGEVPEVIRQGAGLIEL